MQSWKMVSKDGAAGGAEGQVPGADTLTRRVVSHGFRQHGLATAWGAVHENTTGRVDANLDHRGRVRSVSVT